MVRSSRPCGKEKADDEDDEDEDEEEDDDEAAVNVIDARCTRGSHTLVVFPISSPSNSDPETFHSMEERGRPGGNVALDDDGDRDVDDSVVRTGFTEGHIFEFFSVRAPS